MLVLLTHLPTFFFQDYAKFFFGTGKIGVWLFFVLSAFLLTSKFIRSGFSVGELCKYAIGRFVRIIPLFYLAIVVCWVFGAAGIVSLGDIAQAMSFGAGYAHLWTIPVEFKFYLVLPLIAATVIYAVRRFGSAAGLLVSLGLVGAIQLFWPYWTAEINDIRMRLYIPCFVAGVYAAVLVWNGGRRISGFASDCIGFSLIGVLLLLTPGARNLIFGSPFDAWLSDKFVYIGWIWAVFVFLYCDAPGLIGRALKSKVLRLYGAWSYSIYLMHWVVYSGMSKAFGVGVYSALSAFIISTIVGAVLYYAVESPLERWRHSFSSRLFGKRLAAV